MDSGNLITTIRNSIICHSISNSLYNRSVLFNRRSICTANLSMEPRTILTQDSWRAAFEQVHEIALSTNYYYYYR